LIIRKSFKVEMAHIVRNCSSERCRQSIHGHSVLIEVFLKAKQLDKGFMVYDFGLMKGTMGNWIDSFDHTYVLWADENEELKSSIKKFSDRWIELPLSPSAESFAVLFLQACNAIRVATPLKNGEDPHLVVSSVRVHETVTGYAEAEIEDTYRLDDFAQLYKQIVYSDAVRKDWTPAIAAIFDKEPAHA